MEQLTEQKTLEGQLNAPLAEDRLEALRRLKSLMDSGKIVRPAASTDTNNHVHSFYSFSPYSPTMIVYKAVMSGLSTIGLMDHDSISGAEEFTSAGEIADIPTTVGVEIRMDFDGTRLAGRQLDYIEELGIGYNTIHGIPRESLKKIEPMLADIRTKRNERNRAQTEKLDQLIQAFGLSLSFDADVAPLSRMHEGGSVTDRHILYALAKKIIRKHGRGRALIDFLNKEIGLPLSDKVKAMLLDVDFYAYEYDVLNILKGYYTSRFILPSRNDTFPAKQTLEYLRSLGAIPCRCYLGDVEESPTGDKKAMKAEDDFLELFVEESKTLGFEAIAFMPTRNTMAQLERVMALCDKYGMMQVSGEDINQPRQSFITEKLRLPQFAHLEDTTWAVIGSELAACRDVSASIVSKESHNKYPVLNDRIAHFADYGKKHRSAM